MRAFDKLARQRPGLVNRGFEVAVTCYFATGRRELLDLAIESAELLYDDFQRNDPPFNGGERDALNCIQLYRATSSQNTADMAAHVDFPDSGRVHGDDRDFPRRVRAVRMF